MTGIFVTFSYCLIIFTVDSDACSGWSCHFCDQKVELNSQKKLFDHPSDLYFEGVKPRHNVFLHITFSIRLLSWYIIGSAMERELENSGRVLLDLVALCYEIPPSPPSNKVILEAFSDFYVIKFVN